MALSRAAKIALLISGFLVLAPLTSLAQNPPEQAAPPAPSATSPAPTAAPPSATPAETPAVTADKQLLKPEELAALVAPIALYPDNLLSLVVMASTYPVDVVQADRWAKEYKKLKGEQLKAA